MNITNTAAKSVPRSGESSKSPEHKEIILSKETLKDSTVDKFVESSWDTINKTKALGPRLVMAPIMGVISAIPGVGLYGANSHRNLQEGDPNVSTLSKVGTLGTFVSQSAGLAFAAASAGSYLTGLGDPIGLAKFSAGCFLTSGACGTASALGHDWK